MEALAIRAQVLTARNQGSHLPGQVARSFLFKRAASYACICARSCLFFLPESDILVLTETEQGIFEAVLRGNIDFASEPWPQISKDAKQLITHMLDQSPQRRYTAQQVLSKNGTFVSSLKKC